MREVNTYRILCKNFLDSSNLEESERERKIILKLNVRE